MKNFIVIFVTTMLAFSVKAQHSNIIAEKNENAETHATKPQKSGSDWTIQFSGTVTPARTSMIGAVSDGTYLYTGSAGKNMIYKIGFDQKVIDSTTITGMPGQSSSMGANMVGLAYDGALFYMVNGNNYIYEIDLSQKKVTDTITLTSGKNPVGITYAPDADGGNGGFWVSFNSSSSTDLCLYSRSGSVISTITGANLNYNDHGVFWALAYDTISEGGPYLLALERYPQYITRIDPVAKKIVAPRHNVADDMPAWEYYYAYGIYVQNDVYNEEEATLGVFYMSQYHIGYELSSTIALPQTEVNVAAVEMNKFQKHNVPVSIKLDVLNAGIDTVAYFVMNYRVEGTTYSDTISSMKIFEYVKPTTVTHKTAYTPTVNDKVYTIEVWLSDINNTEVGSETVTYTFETFTNYVDRVVLHEGFTSSTCSPCKAGNAQLKKVLDAAPNNRWVCLKYQMNWPDIGDPYYYSELATRRTYYGVNSVPYMAVDGGTAFGGNPYNYTSTMFNTEMQNITFVSLDATFDWNYNKKYNVSVTVNPMKTYSGSYRLFVALVETKTVKNFAKEYLDYYGAPTFYANFDTVFYFVTKKFMTSASGESITLSNGASVTRNFEYEFKGDYRLPADGQASHIININTENTVENFGNIFVVYWVQNYNTKEVIQAGKAGAASSIKDLKLSSDIRIYPNPAKDNISILTADPIKEITIHNLLGQKVETYTGNVTTIPVSELSNGVYVITVKTENNVFNQKFVKE